MSEEKNNNKEKIGKDSYNEIEEEEYEENETKMEIEIKEGANSENIEIKQKPKIKPKLKIDLERQRFPYCIVWTPIPCITWIFPSIGHAGICTSEGIIHDFAGPYFVSVDNMAFGNPTKYIFLDLNQRELDNYDDAIEGGKDDYSEQMYSIAFVAIIAILLLQDALIIWNIKGKLIIPWYMFGGCYVLRVDLYLLVNSFNLI